MPDPDVIVLGGGIVGLCAALRCAQQSLRVLIIDAGHNAGTTTNAGSLHVQLQSRFMRLYPKQAHNVELSLPFYLEAVREWERLESLHGPFELVREGGLMLAENAGQMDFLVAKAQREAAAGLAVDMLDRSALMRLAPWLGEQIVGAELCRDEGKLNPLLANRRLRAAVRKLGVAVRRDRIRHLDEEGAVVLRGDEGIYRCEQLIVAAAWGSGALLEPLGLALPTTAEPLHMNITEAAAAQIDHLIQHAERSITLKQLRTGQIVIGGGWPAQSRGEAQVPAVLAASTLGNVALAGRLVPGIASLRVIRTWAGINTTVDGRTVLGRLPGAPRVLVALPGDAGYTLGPLCGRIAADIVADRAVACSIADFSPARFDCRSLN